MSSTTIRLLLPICVLWLNAVAQNNITHLCEAPPGIRNLSLEELNSKSRSTADDFSSLEHLVELTPDRPKPGSLATMFEATLKEHPDDPGFLYIYGRSLIGKDTPQAIIRLNRVIAADPEIPGTFIALAKIYASRNFRDDSKLLDNVRAYRNLCPASLEGFRYLDKFTDKTEAAALAKQLRARLEKSKNIKDAEHWKSLWAAEFRVAPPSEFDALRERVAGDIRHIEALLDSGNRQVLIVLADGYKLTGRAEEAAKLAQRLYPDEEVRKAYEAFEAQHKLRRNGITRAEYEVIFQEQAKASAEWVAKWPNSRFAWQLRVGSISRDLTFTKEQAEQAGEALLKADADNPFGWIPHPVKLYVAQSWTRYGIRLKDCVAMAQQSLDMILLGPEEKSDLIAPPNAKDIQAMGTFGFDTSIWDALNVIVEASAQLKDFERSRTGLAAMRKWLDENVSKKDDPTTGYARFQARYLYNAGELAQAEGRKLDAAALYARAAAGGWRGSYDQESRPRASWLEQGGTAEGWTLATQPFPVPKPAPPTRPPVRVNAKIETAPSESSIWANSRQPLPEMNLRDAAGKTWTLADLKGKPAYINLWATWCPPCREELPYVQKLYDLVKDRRDIQVITLNLDENPGEVAPFLKENNYKFPVVLARPYVDDFLRTFTIPENWIVDRTGVIRQKSIGFGTRGETAAALENWPREMVEKLLKLVE